MNIWLYDRAAGSSRQLTSGPGGDYQSNWSPDGKTIAFFSSRAGTPDIWTVEPASGALRLLTETLSLDMNPSFSPDARFVAFQSDRSGRLEVWVMRPDGSDPRPLSDTGTAGHFLLWTRDAKAVLYRTPGSSARMMKAALAGGPPEPMGEIAGGAHMSFSPDGSRIMDVVAHKELWVSPLFAVTPERVFEFDDADARIDYPVWSPDGHWVLFDRFRPQGSDIWMMEGFE